MSVNNIIPFNPLDKKNLGASVAEAMLEQPAHQLTQLLPFIGVGIYAIYYSGDFPAYAALSMRNKEANYTAPIYVGKAVPAGARKGGGIGVSGSNALYKRLREHADSIAWAANLHNYMFCGKDFSLL